MPLSKGRKAEYDKQRYLGRKLGSEKLKLGSEKQYLMAHLRYCPNYNPKHPGDHFEHCAYVDPMKRKLGSEKEDSQPKYEQCYLYPDGRVRLDMTVVEPKQCKKIT